MGRRDGAETVEYYAKTSQELVFVSAISAPVSAVSARIQYHADLEQHCDDRHDGADDNTN
jgi:hypothetical protein